jgi:hypothetical protein
MSLSASPRCWVQAAWASRGSRRYLNSIPARTRRGRQRWYAATPPPRFQPPGSTHTAANGSMVAKRTTSPVSGCSYPASQYFSSCAATATQMFFQATSTRVWFMPPGFPASSRHPARRSACGLVRLVTGSVGGEESPEDRWTRGISAPGPPGHVDVSGRCTARISGCRRSDVA